MKNFCLLPVQAIFVNERGKFLKEPMLRDVGLPPWRDAIHNAALKGFETRMQFKLSGALE
jgi:hypothetical protein